MQYTLVRMRCASRTRADLIEYAPKRPLSGRDQSKIRWQQDRCELCRACPLVMNALAIMLPAPVAASAVILRLAG